MNQYVFCGNNPVNFIDPYGLSWGLVVALAGAGVGLIVAGIAVASGGLVIAGAIIIGIGMIAKIMEIKSGSDQIDDTNNDINKIKDRQKELDKIAEGEGFDLYEDDL